MQYYARSVCSHSLLHYSNKFIQFHFDYFSCHVEIEYQSYRNRKRSTGSRRGIQFPIILCSPDSITDWYRRHSVGSTEADWYSRHSVGSTEADWYRPSSLGLTEAES